uniref:Uncharacterized protein n=1 Tax=Tanacetum cinerariifolium TaxID=118510 RepID=A0A699HES2_TANCI|nr:hypothetical protein [Tanacetum cinerariifolium]
MEILSESTSNSSADQMTALQPHSSRVKIQDLPCSIIKDKYMMKAQVHVSKSFVISDIQALPRRKYFLLSSGKASVEGEIVSKLSRSRDIDVTRLQALVDKKKVVVMEAAIKEVLWLDDVEGVDCLPNEEIFAKLACIGQVIEEGGDAKEHVQDETDDNAAQGDDTAAYGEVPTAHHTPPQSPQVKQPSSPPQAQQQAADFPMSLLQEALDACVALTRRVEHIEYDKVAQALEITKLKRRVKKLEKGNMVRVLKLQRIINEMDKDDVVALMDDKEDDKKEEEAKVVKDDQVLRKQAESQAEKYKIDMDHASKVLSMQGDEPAKVQEVVDVVTTAKLITEVVTAASEIVSTIISAAEPQVLTATITAAPVRVVAAPSRRRKGVVIRDLEEESTTSSIIPADTKSKDKGKGIMVEEPKPLKKKQQVEMDEEYARKLHVELNKDIDWDAAIDHVKKKAKEDPVVQRYQAMKRKPQTEAQA